MNGSIKVGKEIKHRWVWLAAATVVGFVIDLVTKYFARTRLECGEPVSAVGDYLQWLLVYNKGAVFGMDPAAVLPAWLPANVFFVTFMSAAIAFLLFYYYMLKKNEVLMHVGLMLVLPGAFGNLFDRVFLKDAEGAPLGVVDFIRMGFPPDNYWFIYNVADIYVTFGVAVMLFSFICDARGKDNSECGPCLSRRSEAEPMRNSELKTNGERDIDDGRDNNIGNDNELLTADSGGGASGGVINNEGGESQPAVADGAKV